MKELLSVIVADDGDISITTDYEFPEAGQREVRFDRQESQYARLVEALRRGSADCLHAIRMQESARKDARYEYEGLHPDLEEALLKWRRNAAAARNVPAYYIMHQRVLLGIADAAPQSEEELLALAGVGPMLLSRYGSEILAITRTV